MGSFCKTLGISEMLPWKMNQKSHTEAIYLEVFHAECEL